MKKSSLFVLSFFAAIICTAEEKLWQGGSVEWPADGWTNDAYWVGGAPGNDDVAMFNVAITARVDAASLPAAKMISGKVSSDIWLELDTSSRDFTFGGMLGGTLKVVKKGLGTLTLSSARKEGQIYGYYTDFSCKQMTILSGTLKTPVNNTPYVYPVLEIAEGATFSYATSANVLLTSLSGAGNLVNISGAARTLQIGVALSTYVGRFSGKIGSGFNVVVFNNQSLTGIENEFNSIYVDYGSGEAATYGVLGFSSLGNAGAASSVGVGSSIDTRRAGRLLYLGEGEVATKSIYIRTENDTPAVIDGGAEGGLVLNGAIEAYSSDAANNKMGELVLDGSNKTACVINGGYTLDRTAADSTPVTLYTAKKGTGTWRFADVMDRRYSGGIGVFEGTLQFESIAEAGVNCSLGLATNLSYFGDYNLGRKAPYAYLLGDANSKNAVFEFVGAKKNSCSTRPMALGGNATIRANGKQGASISFSGVSALADGPQIKTLTIDGTNADNNVIADISNGDGTLSLVKDGLGVWTLAGNQTFSGTLNVKSGTLKVEKGVFPTWFRLTIRCVSDVTKARLLLREFAFYDEDGYCVSEKLAFKPGNVELIGGSTYTSAHKPAELKPGEFTVADTSAMRYRMHDSYAFDKLFDGSNDAVWIARTDNKVPNGENPLTYFILVMRVNSDKPVTTFDLAQFYGDAYPTSIQIDASVDGVNWTEGVYAASNTFESRGDGWCSDKKPISAPQPRLLSAGSTIPMGVTIGNSSVLENVESVTVSPGAVLERVGCYSPVVSKLIVDGMQGFGTISGFALAPNVTIDIVNGFEGGRYLPVGFAGLSGFDEASWSFTVNGVPRPDLKFRLTKNSLKIRDSNGLMILIK
jgi:autotransporter-associated beta strand protein